MQCDIRNTATEQHIQNSDALIAQSDTHIMFYTNDATAYTKYSNAVVYSKTQDETHDMNVPYSYIVLLIY